MAESYKKKKQIKMQQKAYLNPKEGRRRQKK